MVGSGTEAAAPLPGRCRPGVVGRDRVGPAAAALADGWLPPSVPADRWSILPASPDGRDLAPRLAAALGRPLVAHAVSARRRQDPETAPAATPSVGPLAGPARRPGPGARGRRRAGGGHPGPGQPGRAGPARERRHGPSRWPASDRSGPRWAGPVASRPRGDRRPGARPAHHGPGRCHPGGGRRGGPGRRAATIDGADRALRPAGGGGGGAGRVGRCHPGGHRRRMDRLRAPDRHHRGDHRPRPLHRLRGVGGRPARRRARDAPAHRQRQHRPLVPDDGHGRPRPGHRRPGPAGRAGPALRRRPGRRGRRRRRRWPRPGPERLDGHRD